MANIVSKTAHKFEAQGATFVIDADYPNRTALENAKLDRFDGVKVIYYNGAEITAVCIQTLIQGDRVVSSVVEIYKDLLVGELPINKSFKDGSMTVDNTTFVNLATGSIVTREEATDETGALKAGYATQIMYFRLSPTAGQISGYIQNGLLARY